MKLEVIHLVETHQFLLTPPWHVVLEVDGVALPKNVQSVVPAGATVVHVYQKPAQLLHYVDVAGEQMSVDRYGAALERILDGATREDDGGVVLRYVSLEQEFEHRKFLQDWKPVYSEPEVLREPVVLEVVEVRRDSGDPDIVSLWNHPCLDRQRHLYRMNAAAIEKNEFIRRCRELQLAHDVPSHSHLEFAKIGGKYVFDASFKTAPEIIGTLDECKQAKARHIARVQTVVNRYCASVSDKPLPNVGYAISQAQKALSHLQGAQLRASSRGSLSGARTALNELIDVLAKEVA